MTRIFHHYELWEDWKAGFYDNSTTGLNNKLESACRLFNSESLTNEYMNKVINDWPYSCEQYLSNPHANRVAYIGQAACCIYDGIPNLITMRAWNLLDVNIKKRSDMIAKSIIIKWELKQKSINTFPIGKNEGMKRGYQMRLFGN